MRENVNVQYISLQRGEAMICYWVDRKGGSHGLQQQPLKECQIQVEIVVPMPKSDGGTAMRDAEIRALQRIAINVRLCATACMDTSMPTCRWRRCPFSQDFVDK